MTQKFVRGVVNVHSVSIPVRQWSLPAIPDLALDQHNTCMVQSREVAREVPKLLTVFRAKPRICLIFIVRLVLNIMARLIKEAFLTLCCQIERFQLDTVILVPVSNLFSFFHVCE